MLRRRYLSTPVRRDLAEKMVFLSGPRQVGKTTLAQAILKDYQAGVYFSWDNRADRGDIRAARWPAGEAMVVLDEIHKWRAWKSWIKGEYDKHRDHLRFLVTGSARLDVYRRGGDSLQGRYHSYRLHPFSYAELESDSGRDFDPGEALEMPAHARQEPLALLMQFGGFPEPLLAQSPRTLRRWQRERLDRFFREDVRDLEAIRDLAAIQLLADLLPARVGSPLSLNSLREDLEVSHRAVTFWVDVLERLYHLFRVPPYSGALARTLKKMPKAYLWDSSLVSGEAARFENLIALHLLKFCHFLHDHDGHDAQLFYLRDKLGREVDFLVTIGRQPWFAVEAKMSETRIDPSLRYFRDRLRIPFVYQAVLSGDRDFVEDGVRCLPARKLLAALV